MHLIILKINFVFFLLLKSAVSESQIGDSCFLDNSNENGTCKNTYKCTSAYDNAEPIFCNPDGFDWIICCKTVFKTLKSECVVEKTGELGVYKLLEHCPEITKEDKAPVICEHKFCEDLVCCPIKKKTKRMKNVCKNYDEPFQAITTRLEHFNYSCTIKSSNKSGFITKTDYCKSSNDEMVCKYDFCEGWTCCESENFADNLECFREFHENINFIGDSCTDTLTGKFGTCRRSEECPEVSSRFFSNVTFCGYDCCKAFVCCPEVESSHHISKSSKFLSYYFEGCIVTKFLILSVLKIQ